MNYKFGSFIFSYRSFSLRISKTSDFTTKVYLCWGIDKTRITHSLGISTFTFEANVLKSMIPTVLSLLVEMKIELKIFNPQWAKITIFIYMVYLSVIS